MNLYWTIEYTYFFPPYAFLTLHKANPYRFMDHARLRFGRQKVKVALPHPNTLPHSSHPWPHPSYLARCWVICLRDFVFSFEFVGKKTWP